MKKTFISILMLGALFYACDKVDQPHPAAVGGLDWSLYPEGDSAHYAQNYWPEFTQNVNTERNLIIEDFTGHRCVYCPGVTSAVEDFAESDPERIFPVAIHSNNAGVVLGSLQDFLPPNFTHQFFNDEGLEIGAYIGSIPGSSFISNPKITIQRLKNNGDIALTPAFLATIGNGVLTSSPKISIQAEANYFTQTRGLFLHTEVEKLDAALTNELSTVVCLLEDSIVAPQELLGNIVDYDYVHRNVLRGCIDHKPFGQKLDAAHLNANGKYYFNYSYKLPSDYNPDNMHLLIYVYDKITHEIYQVIKHEL